MATSSPDLPGPASSGAATASDPVAHTLALLQPWIDYVPRQQRRLGLFIFLALLAHLTAFFFIRIDSTRAELRHQARVHVSVEPPQAVALNGQPADDFWGQLTDPRLYILPLHSTGGSASAPASPSFALINGNLGSGELPPPAVPENYQLSQPAIAPLQQRVEQAMQPPRQPFSYDETPPAIASTTTWQVLGDLAARQPLTLPSLPSPVSDTDLSPTVLRVGVDPDGTVEHALVDQSSGDLGAPSASELDQQAVLAARKIRFLPSDQPGLQWGFVTVFWHYSAKPREEVVPTPPSGT